MDIISVSAPVDVLKKRAARCPASTHLRRLLFPVSPVTSRIK